MNSLLRVNIVCFILLVLAVLVTCPARAGSQAASHNIPMEIGADAEIRLTPVSDLWPTGGFMPVRVRIENRADVARAWTFVFNSERNWREKMEFTQSLAVGARSVLESVIFVPGLGKSSSGNAIQLTAWVQGPGIDRKGAGLTNYNNDLSRYLASSPSQEVDLYAAISASPEGGGGAGTGPGGGGHGGTRSATMELAVVDAATWPADWRVWSPFTQVVMSEREFLALDGARRAALMDWVAFGGTLSLYPPFAAASPPPKLSTTAWGAGVVRKVPASLSDDKTVQPDDAREKSFHRQLLDQANAAALPPGTVEPYSLSRGSVGITLFLLLFGILIGPVNLLVFAPTQRRHRLFVTVPLISLAASVVLAVIIVWRDGFGGAGVQSGVVILLPGENKAAVFQDQLSRTGVLSTSRFTLPSDTQFVLPAANLTSATNPNRDKQFARDESSASGAWFASRQRQQHVLQRITPTRARIELVAGGEAGAPPVVQSSVGTALRDFRYRDPARKLWGADEVAPGRKVTLRALRSASADLPPGNFLGRAAASDLAPLATLPSIRWDAPVFFYTGRVEGLPSTP
jgi:hypothetical protein